MTLEEELRDIIEQMKTIHQMRKVRYGTTVEFEEGLSDREISEIEERCNFRFPPDLKLFLQLTLPTGDISLGGVEQFPNWRKNPVEIMRRSNWAWRTQFYFDIKRGHFWITEFGEKPKTLADQLAVVKNYLKNVSVMIPINAHRLLPADPCEAGNPVFSVVHLHDTIYYGYNLQNYLRNEFLPWEMNWGEDSDYRHIPFWSKLAAGRFS